ncbi:MAG: hypothetical protein HOJ79_04565 [Nitrospina sp.]|nr:hypothetical protein [Nitrospina sp.]
MNSELFVAFGGFLLVFIGGLLRREGQARNKDLGITDVHIVDRMALP